MNIDEFGEIIDHILINQEIILRICFPKGTMEAQILSSSPSPVFDFYLIIHAMKNNIGELLKLEPMDKRKKEKLLDGMLNLIKREVLKEDK